jgi:hypothetical protein
MLRAVVCWPWCPESNYQRVHEAMGVAAQTYRVSIATIQHLESLFVQVYARLFVGEGYSIPKLPFDGTRTEAVCYVSDTDLPEYLAQALDEGTFIADGADPEELERVIRAFEKPMLTYDGFEKNNDTRTRDLASQAYSLRQAAWNAGVSDALFYGDVAMLCYGLRRAASNELRAIVADGFVRPDQKKILSDAGVETYSMAEWIREHSVLVHYNGIDMNAVARKDFAYFMGLKIPTADASFSMARAMYGRKQTDSQLLDAMMLKSLMGSDLPLPCLFGSLVATEGLSHSPRLEGLIKAYEASRNLVAARLCPDGARDFNFHVRNTTNAKGEFDAARKIQAAVKGLPVIPAYYGTIECSGKTKLALEPFDMTLETWMSKERTASAWLEVLTRIVWCALALERDAKMHHSRLEPNNVLLRSTECLMRQKAPSALLMQTSLPDSNWDVRLHGVQHIKPGVGKPKGKTLAQRILGQAFLLPPAVADVLESMSKPPADGSYWMHAAQILDNHVNRYSDLRPKRAPRGPKKK